MHLEYKTNLLFLVNTIYLTFIFFSCANGLRELKKKKKSGFWIVYCLFDLEREEFFIYAGGRL